MLLCITYIQMFAVDRHVHGIILHQLDSFFVLFFRTGPRSWPAEEVVDDEVWESYLVPWGLIILDLLITVFGSRSRNVVTRWYWGYCGVCIIIGSQIALGIWSCFEVVLDLRCRSQSSWVLRLIGGLEKIDLSGYDLALRRVIDR